MSLTDQEKSAEERPQNQKSTHHRFAEGVNTELTRTTTAYFDLNPLRGQGRQRAGGAEGSVDFDGRC